MPWPIVWRSTLERVEDKLIAEEFRYKDLERRYEELRVTADRLLEAMVEKPAPELEPEKPLLPSRPLRRDIISMATAAKDREYAVRQKEKAKA